MTLQEKFNEIRKILPDQIAKEIVETQPMPVFSEEQWNKLGEAFENMINYRKSLGIKCCHDILT